MTTYARWRMYRDRHINDAACPHCGAEQGQPCLGVYGQPLASGVHSPRREAAKIARRNAKANAQR